MRRLAILSLPPLLAYLAGWHHGHRERWLADHGLLAGRSWLSSLSIYLGGGAVTWQDAVLTAVAILAVAYIGIALTSGKRGGTK